MKLKVATRCQPYRVGVLTTIILGVAVVFLSLSLRLAVRDVIDRALPYLMPILGLEARLFASDDYQNQIRMHTNSLAIVKNSRLILIGDSHAKNLDGLIVADGDALNLGIGGDTSLGVLTRMRMIPNAISPEWIVFFVGYNDTKYRDINGVVTNIKAAIVLAQEKWPAMRGIVVVGPLPVATRRLYVNSELRLLGSALSALCSHEPCEYFDPMPLFTNKNGTVESFFEDGVHLSRTGYMRLSHELAKSIEKTGSYHVKSH